MGIGQGQKHLAHTVTFSLDICLSIMEDEDRGRELLSFLAGSAAPSRTHTCSMPACIARICPQEPSVVHGASIFKNLQVCVANLYTPNTRSSFVSVVLASFLTARTYVCRLDCGTWACFYMRAKVYTIWPIFV